MKTRFSRWRVKKRKDFEKSTKRDREIVEAENDFKEGKEHIHQKTTLFYFLIY